MVFFRSAISSHVNRIKLLSVWESDRKRDIGGERKRERERGDEREDKGEKGDIKNNDILYANSLIVRMKTTIVQIALKTSGLR